MHAAVMERAAGCDAVIMSAAVADYTPAERSPQKVKKGDGPVTITFNRTKDILGELGKLPSRKQRRPVLIGFAAETKNVVAYAQDKLTRKGVDLVVANDVSRSDGGFDVETNAVTLVSAGGTEELPVQTKSAVAATILDRVERLLPISARSAEALAKADLKA
jgi:phosphopantothenoylcysteine decarboxylase/phosphopantothenate--cysteine ligase